MFAPKGIAPFHNDCSELIPAQSRVGADVLFDKFLYRFQR
jgi:hypothetical protein